MTGEKFLRVCTYLMTAAVIVNITIVMSYTHFKPYQSEPFIVNFLNVLLPGTATILAFFNKKYSENKVDEIIMYFDFVVLGYFLIMYAGLAALYVLLPHA